MPVPREIFIRREPRSGREDIAPSALFPDAGSNLEPMREQGAIADITDARVQEELDRYEVSGSS